MLRHRDCNSGCKMLAPRWCDAVDGKANMYINSALSVLFEEALPDLADDDEGRAVLRRARAPLDRWRTAATATSHKVLLVTTPFIAFHARGQESLYAEAMWLFAAVIIACLAGGKVIDFAALQNFYPRGIGCVCIPLIVLCSAPSPPRYAARMALIEMALRLVMNGVFVPSVTEHVGVHIPVIIGATVRQELWAAAEDYVWHPRRGERVGAAYDCRAAVPARRVGRGRPVRPRVAAPAVRRQRRRRRSRQTSPYGR